MADNAADAARYLRMRGVNRAGEPLEELIHDAADSQTLGRQGRAPSCVTWWLGGCYRRSCQNGRTEDLTRDDHLRAPRAHMSPLSAADRKEGVPVSCQAGGGEASTAE